MEAAVATELPETELEQVPSTVGLHVSGRKQTIQVKASSGGLAPKKGEADILPQILHTPPPR